MALSDYRQCDVCNGKAFYDAHMSYEDGMNEFAAKDKPFRIAGQEQYVNPATNQKHGMRLGYVGDWAVICSDCAKTHKCVVVDIAITTHTKNKDDQNG